MNGLRQDQGVVGFPVDRVAAGDEPRGPVDGDRALPNGALWAIEGVSLQEHVEFDMEQFRAFGIGIRLAVFPPGAFAALLFLAKKHFVLPTVRSTRVGERPSL